MLVEIGEEISREEAVKVANRILQDSEEGRKTIAELEEELEKGCKCQKKSN